MSYVPPTDDPVDADRIVSEVFGELANSRPDVRAILTTLMGTLSRLRRGTWVGALMNRDPSTSLIVAADAREPAFASYVHRSVAAIHNRDRARTTGLSMHVAGKCWLARIGRHD